MASLFNKVEDRVYVRDEQFEWLPAVVLELQEDQALVRFDLPRNWHKTTLVPVESGGNANAPATRMDAAPNSNSLDKQERWVQLKDYCNHHLPLQNARICRDMAELEHLHEAEILYQIKERHCIMEKPYTRVREMIVAVNPCRWIPNLYSVERQQFYSDNFAQAYSRQRTENAACEEKKDDEAFTAASSISFGTSEYDRLGCEPHIYEISSLAYQRLTQDQKNQTILVSGESGAGKTETVKIVLKHLATIGPALSGSDDDLVSHLLESSPIFEAFGNAKTHRNNNSSRFGKVTKLHYSVSGVGTCLVGSSFDTYLLETNRVVSHVKGERNFHIFYQLLSASGEIKRELLGPDWYAATARDFQYLNKSSSCINEGRCDATNWNQTLKALISFGWDGSSLERLMRALGIILLIGNIAFTEANDDQASIAKSEDLIILSLSLGIPVEEMELALTQRTIQTAHDLLLVPYTPDQAKEACEALAKAIYNGVFKSIVRQINVLTSAPPAITGKHKYISLVDIFGFESFEVNRFEQFCINFANERLQQKYILDILRRHKIEYEAEGLVLPDWNDIDNSSTVELFEGQSGLIKTLNEQCIRPNGSSEVFVFKAKHSNKNHDRLIQDKLQLRSEFGVKHFAGVVTYDASNFVARNADKLPDFLISVAATSTNDLIAQELGELMKESNAAFIIVKKKATHRTVIDKFSGQLKDLMDSIDNSQNLYIRCIKPSEDVGTTTQMDHQTVIRQLRCAGLVTAIELSRETFPNKLPFASVERRFSCLLPFDKLLFIKEMELHDKAQLILSILFARFIEQHKEGEFVMPFAFGHTKVFFRAGALETLEKQRQERFARSASRIQQTVRKALEELQYRRVRMGITRLQARCRGRTLTLVYRQKRLAATKIQACTRSAIKQAQFLLARDCIFYIEVWWLAVRTRLHYKRIKLTEFRMKEAAIVLTAWARSRTRRIRYRRMKLGATLLQARFRSRRLAFGYHMKQQAARTIARWTEVVLARRRFKRMQAAAAITTAWSRARIQRVTFVRMKEAATIVTAWSRSQRERSRFKGLKAASNIVCVRRRAQVKTQKHRAAAKLQACVRASQQIQRYKDLQFATKTKHRLHEENSAAAKLQFYVRVYQAAKQKAATAASLAQIVEPPCASYPSLVVSVTTVADVSPGQVVVPTNERDCVFVSKKVVEQVELYKRQVDHLNSDIMHVTAEAELHKQEVEAEFEERLAEYEEEVLQLKQMIQCYEEEKITLKDEIAANVENVGNLKTGIRSMQEAHREYLNKVMRAIENANTEHQKALETLKLDRDARVTALTAEINRLKKARRKSNDASAEKRQDDIYHLARKLEKLVSPDHITAMAEKASLQSRSMLEYIEEKISAKARKIIYRLEDIAVTPGTASSQGCLNEKECIQGLQQQLVVAYEEIERLQTEASRRGIRADPMRKRGLRKIFER